MYDISDIRTCKVARLLGNTVAKGEGFGPCALSVCESGERLAFIGPLESTVTLLDAETLDEVNMCLYGAHVYVKTSSKNQAFGSHPSLHPQGGSKCKTCFRRFPAFVISGISSMGGTSFKCNMGNSPHLIVPSD